MAFLMGVDVDETFTPTAIKWLKWMNDVCGTQRTLGDCDYDYRLSLYFPEMDALGIDPMAFWRNVGLYETSKPMEGAVDTLQKLKQTGHNIVFISYCKSMHMSSKVKFVKRYCPFLDFGNGDGFIATKEKGVLGKAVDVMIDDRVKYLNQFPESTHKILFNSPYRQEVKEKDNNFSRVDNWKGVERVLKNKGYL